jgi:hypothetical protein
MVLASANGSRFISKISLICVDDAPSNVIETHEHAGQFKEW